MLADILKILTIQACITRRKSRSFDLEPLLDKLGDGR